MALAGCTAASKAVVLSTGYPRCLPLTHEQIMDCSTQSYTVGGQFAHHERGLESRLQKLVQNGLLIAITHQFSSLLN